ncbi:MAG: DUF4389 domain-containing protein [Coxiellaceae bacterium]|nr:DUF4389 domain-containing protein [Coxiellaceae bacterium]
MDDNNQTGEQNNPSQQSSSPGIAVEIKDCDYPLQYSVDYKEKLGRWSTFFRIILVIPIIALYMTIAGGVSVSGSSVVVGAGGLLFLGPLLMILFRKRYPRWWFNWNLELTRFLQRITIYYWCLTDEYPSVEEQQQVHLDIKYPEPDTLSRGMPLVKWFLAIPHYVVLAFLGIFAVIVMIIGWFSVLFVGYYPRSMFNYIVGYQRWFLRVYAYAFMLVTDKYPPFSLDQ